MTNERRISRFALISSTLALGALVAAPELALAQTAKTVPVKAATASSGASCGPAKVTTVAAMNNTKYGAIVNVYSEPNASSATLVNSLAVGLEIKGVVVFTVVETQGDWLHVNVPARPNGKTGWVKKSDVHTYQHRYAVTVELGRRRMTVCNAGRVIQTETVAVGTSKDPTPTGSCFTEDLIKPKGGPNGAYGPYAFGLSCFSESPELENWNGGDGRIGIHGTNAPKLLGQAVSHGCVRVSNTGITKLAKTLPLGVPVEITA